MSFLAFTDDLDLDVPILDSLRPVDTTKVQLYTIKVQLYGISARLDRIESMINKVSVCCANDGRNGGLDARVLLLPLFASLYM